MYHPVECGTLYYYYTVADLFSHPSPSLPSTTCYGQHRPAPPSPTAVPPTIDEAGKGDGLAKGGKRKSKFKMFCKEI